VAPLVPLEQEQYLLLQQSLPQALHRPWSLAGHHRSSPAFPALFRLEDGIFHESDAKHGNSFGFHVLLFIKSMPCIMRTSHRDCPQPLIVPLSNSANLQ
jgi:hypothetical protein